MADDSTDVKVLVGRALGKLDEIGKRLDRQDESRAGLHGRLDSQSAQIHEIGSNVSDLTHRITIVEEHGVRVLEVVERVETAERAGRMAIAVGRPIVRFGKWIIGTALAIVIAFWREILDWWRGG